MIEARHRIKMVARLTGLSPCVLRIWEQRYRAVEPRRTLTNHRLYSSRNVERLNLLREVTHAGYNIGQVATLPVDKLRELANDAAGRRARGASLREVLDRIGAVIIKDLPQLGLTLDDLRKPSRKEKR